MSQRDLSARQLRAFAALAEQRNFTRAAQRCHLSQPAFSALIRTLEETLGTRLLDSRLERIVLLANNSIWPLFAAVAVAIAAIGSMFSLWFVPAGLILAYISIVGWLWPKNEEW